MQAAVTPWCASVSTPWSGSAPCSGPSITYIGSGTNSFVATGSTSMSASDYCEPLSIYAAGSGTQYKLHLVYASTPPSVPVSPGGTVDVSVCAEEGIKINCGGSATGDFIADAYYSGGSAYGTGSTISGGSASQAVYQDMRGFYYTPGTITYTIPCSLPGTHTVKLHFAAIYFTGAGDEIFDVKINGTTVLNDFDIVAAGGSLAGVDRSFSATPVSGYITIQVIPEDADPPFGAYNASINGIQVFKECN